MQIKQKKNVKCIFSSRYQYYTLYTYAIFLSVKKINEYITITNSTEILLMKEFLPNPSTTELFLRSSLDLFLLLSPLVMSCPNSAPIIPSSITAVDCFLFNSDKLEGFLICSSSSSSNSSS